MQLNLPKRTRFAPSPTGLLHTGNAYSALLCQRWAKANQAELLLRLEDIDFTRCKAHFSQQIIDDLAWLNIDFSADISYQQQRLQHYRSAMDKLKSLGVLYPCSCTRSQIKAMVKPSQHTTLDAYPFSCRKKTIACTTANTVAWRLNQKKVSDILGEALFWTDLGGEQHHFAIQSIGDVVIGRKDIGFSYHLSVVVDDALQGISHIIRGDDLRSSTPVHCILQALLGYSSPIYHHHALICDPQGKRLAKSKQSITLKSLRDAGKDAESLRASLLASHAFPF